MFKNVSRKCRQNRGFTLMEVMVVVAILAVVVLIAVPSVIKMRQNMKFAERNDYAKSIYMAAQSNLTQMRSMGELGTITPPDEAYKASPPTVPYAKAQISNENSPNPPSSYLHAGNKAEIAYNYWSDILPANAIDSTVRDGQHSQIIIEYNPQAGIVYSVFYYDDDDFDLTSEYNNGTLTRISEDIEQHSPSYGYYTIKNVDALEDTALKVFNVSSSISYDNGQEGLLTVYIPTQSTENGITNIFDGEIGSLDKYVQQLKIELTVTGENSGTFKTVVKETNAIVPYTVKDLPGESGGSNFVHIEIPLDSLKSASNSFSSNPSNTVTSEAGITSSAIPAGDNISVTADITFYPDADDPIVMIESATIAGINPMYHSLTPNPNFNTAENAQNTEKPYILAISNGRHLQNLSYLDADFAQNIESIVFTQQAEDPTQSGSGSTGESQPADTPSPVAETETNGSGTLTLDWLETAKSYVKKANNEPVVSADFPFTPIEFKDFTYVPSILGNGVTIKNLNITDSENAGLFAILKDTKIQDIKLGETNTISGGKNTGALAGSAEGATIVNCETAAIVSGANAVQCNVGGLIGKATDTSLETCDSHATVTSGTTAGNDSSKNALGGLVGYAVSSSNINKTTLTSCKAHSDTTVTSAQGSLSDIGGVVGHAKNAVFNTCSSWAVVAGMDTAPENSQVDIPNNNLGGFVGKSEGSNYTNPYVKLSKLPDYGTDAGGFAGLLYGGEVRTLNVELAVPQNSPAPHINNFGGIASICDNSAMINDANITVDSEHSIVPATNKAGGAFAILDGYSTVSDSRIVLNSTISSNQAAGFAVVIGSNVNVNTSYVLGSVSSTSENHDAAGFVFQNGGTIERCFANVNMSHGNAFVTVNGAPVKNCYGWIWGSADLRITQNCSYSYFVNGKTNDMVFYEELTEKNGKKNVSEPSSNILDTKALSHPWAVDLLNAGTPKKSDGTPDKDNEPWEKGNNGYSYPELKDLGHQGASSAPVEGDYPFGLIYEETYGTDKGYLLIPLSDDAPAHPDMPELDNDKEITDTAFYLYHITDSDISGTAHSYDKFKWISLSQLYTIYELSAKDYEVDDVAFTTYYPINSDGSLYKIRTPEQFGNIDKHSGSTFHIEKSMTVEKAIDSFSGTMTASSNVVIDASQLTQAMIGELKGSSEKEAKLSGLTVDGLKAPLVATVKSGGKIENCTLTKVNITSGTNVGAFAGTLEGGTISGGSAEGSVSGSNYVGGAIGHVKSGTVTGVTNVNVAVSATGENAKAGMFVGYAEGGSFSNCKSTKNTETLPFGFFATRSIQGNPTHYSKKNLNGDNLYEFYFTSTDDTIKFYETLDNNSKTLISNIDEACTFVYKDGTVKALDGKALYYYAVSDTYSFETSGEKSITVKITEADAKSIPTYSACVEKPSAVSDYFIQVGNNYHRLFVSISVEDATETSEEKTVFTFTYGSEKTALLTQKLTSAQLSSQISLDNKKFYVTSGSIPAELSGSFLIHGDSKYLTYKANGGWSTSDPTTNMLWYPYGSNSWRNWNEVNAESVTEAAIIEMVKNNETLCDTFIAPVLVTVRNANNEIISQEYIHHLYLEKVTLHYAYTLVDVGYSIFYPTN